MTAQTITLLATAHDEYGCPNPGVPAWRIDAATSFVDMWALVIEAEGRRMDDAYFAAVERMDEARYDDYGFVGFWGVFTGGMAD